MKYDFKKCWLVLAGAVLLAGGSMLRADDVTNTNHSVVRFDIFTGGTNFGSIEIELFDQEKPQTARNFLNYVYQGVYSNLVLHRLVPGFALQGGYITVTNPGSQEPFLSYTPGANFGTISNEFNTGPLLSNDYGTIAMARIPGNPDSASSQFFFNLTNNTDLNTSEGGYAVFGRVVNTSGARSGTNLLNYFSTFTDGVGVGSVLIQNTSEYLTELPVSTNRTTQLKADLFTVNATILRGPQVPATNHTVVRMRVSTGTNHVGNIDVELFDQERPVSARNFLLYVYSGVYSNLVLNRLEPGFVLQAGRMQVPNPATNSTFTTYTPGVLWGPITNEYSVGPELHNDLGTISLARVSGETNSGENEFFFNLADNQSLDSVDGGFTVFGRVVNSYDNSGGTNLLGYFNGFSNGHGIGSAFIVDFFDFLTELPVSVNRGTPLYSDLYTVNSFVIQGRQTRDANPPSLLINGTTLPVRTTNGTYQFSGTASDNDEVAKVLLDGPLGRSTTDGGPNWSANLTLTPGTNTILLRSLDYFGNLSDGQERVIFYSVPHKMSLQVQGKGKVTGITNGQMMEEGVTYPLSAKPASGYYFNGWQNAISSYARDVSFTLAQDTNVTVRFSKTLLGLVTGTYQGVFAPDTNGPSQSSGLMSVKLGAGGIYSGKLAPIGASYGVRGKFDAAGNSLILGQVITNRLALALSLQAEGSEALAGQYSDGYFLSSVKLWRVQTFGRTNPAALAGTYTFQLSPPLASNSGVTDGSGFGTLTVDAKGVVNLSGRLADGSSFKQKSALAKGNTFPFYYTVKKGDTVAGQVTFDTNRFLSASVRWFAPGFPGRTNQNVTLSGGPYTPPPAAPIFQWTNGLIKLTGGGLAAPITVAATLQNNGTLLVADNTNGLHLTVTNANGGISGGFIHPITHSNAVLQGVIFQGSNNAAGYFPGAGRFGRFVIQAAP